MKNPIVDNRIVENIRFATILNDTLHKILNGEAVDRRDIEYMTYISDDLLAYQRHTCTEQAEKDYFERIGKPLTEIIAIDERDISELAGKTITSINGLRKVRRKLRSYALTVRNILCSMGRSAARACLLTMFVVMSRIYWHSRIEGRGSKQRCE